MNKKNRFIKKYLLFISMLISALLTNSQVSIKKIFTKNLVNPIGIEEEHPRFSWELISEKRNVIQKAYEIKVVSGKITVWNSGKILSDQSVHVPYLGAALQSGKKYNWQVRIWDNSEKPSAWTQLSSFQMALLSKNEWKAKWISAGYKEDSMNRPAVYFRKEFTATKKIVCATAYITAHGMYEAQLNGKKIGDDYLTPGWTSYKKRLQYQEYDVTELLQKGKNVCGATIGNGWYRGFLGWSNTNNLYGKTIDLLMQLTIEYADGTRENIITDETWKSSTGSIRFAEIYHGETIDAREERNGWANTMYNDQEWLPVKIENHSYDNLVATYNEPVKKQEIF